MAGEGPAGIRSSRTLAVAILAAVLLIATLAFGGARAESAPSLETANVQADAAMQRSCFEEIRGDDAVDSVTLTAPRFGYLAAALDAESGDWDLGIFDAASGESLSGSASAGPEELAQAYVIEGQKLIVQACRISGEAARATLSLGIEPIDADGRVERQRLVRVETPTDRKETLLQSLGLDLTESAGPDFIDVLLHGADDRKALQSAGFDSEVLIGDLVEQSTRDRRADARFAAEAETSALPSGRTTYRLLADYQQELKTLAAENPDLVKPITLNHKTLEGRPVEGIEITTNPDQVQDGKPVFLQMGLHHAREWPSGEHAIEWAYELIQGYRRGDATLKALVEQTRTIVVPVINPDGFNASRNAGQLNGNGGGNTGDTIVQFATAPDEYRRKNCRIGTTETANCSGSVGLAENGVDPNRNYGGFWGGPGASDSPEAATYRGAGPFSEPETQNVRDLVSERAVVTLITNHTFSNLVLRPPGLAILGDSVDEPLYKTFGAAMTAENGYLNQKGFELYDTSGTTEDFTYTATGGLGFTFEIGCNQGDDGATFDPAGDCIGSFHPRYEQMVDEYEGRGPAALAVNGGGNRAAYLVAQRSTANENRHSVLTGRAPAGATLRVDKDLQIPTWKGYSEEGAANPGPAFLDDHLTTAMRVPASGEFAFHINPSTSPYAAQDTGRPQDGGPPQAQIDFSGNNATTVPPAGCADFATEDPNCWNDHPFEINTTSDNEAATVHIEWTSPANDWDVKVFRDTNGDGSSEGEPASAEVGQSAQGPTTEESTTFVDPETASGKLLPGKYVIRVINFVGTDPVTGAYDGTVTFTGPEPFKAGTTESWTFTCRSDGEVRFSEQITIDRGQARNLDLAEKCAAPDSGGPGGPGNGGPGGNGVPKSCGIDSPNLIRGTRGKDTMRGTNGNDAMLARGGSDTAIGRKGDDCVYGQRGRDRIRGNGGDDMLKGGRGLDRLRGGGGGDVLRGGKGNDVLRGGGGKNVFKCGRGNRDEAFSTSRKDKISKSCEKVTRRF